MEERGNGSFWWGMVVGAAVGATAALLTSPKRGEELRSDLMGTARDVGHKAGAAWGDVKDKASDMVGQVKNRAQDAVDAGKDAAASKRQELEMEFDSSSNKNM